MIEGETSGQPQAPRIPSSSPITQWSRTYLTMTDIMTNYLPAAIYIGYNGNLWSLHAQNNAWWGRYVKYVKRSKILKFFILHDSTCYFDIMGPYPEPGVSGDIIAPGACEHQDHHLHSDHMESGHHFRHHCLRYWANQCRNQQQGLLSRALNQTICPGSGRWHCLDVI